jgi:hypothetical protein
MISRMFSVALLTMLVVVPSSEAECAWVLWLLDSIGWRHEDVFDSREKCVSKITQLKQQFDSDRLSTWYMLGLQKETSETRVSYRLTLQHPFSHHVLCLPASMDPRVPKGATR